MSAGAHKYSVAIRLRPNGSYARMEARRSHSQRITRTVERTNAVSKVSRDLQIRQ